MAPPTPNATRSGFSTSFGILAATLGSAVGLGNIWKVPYLTGANGGAGFLLVYLLATLLIGLPVMIAEIALGRSVRANPISVLRTLAPGRQPWWLVGLSGMLAAFLIMSFYSEVVAWVIGFVLTIGQIVAPPCLRCHPASIRPTAGAATVTLTL